MNAAGVEVGSPSGRRGGVEGIVDFVVVCSGLGRGEEEAVSFWRERREAALGDMEVEVEGEEAWGFLTSAVGADWPASCAAMSGIGAEISRSRPKSCGSSLPIKVKMWRALAKRKYMKARLMVRYGRSKGENFNQSRYSFGFLNSY